MRSLEEHFSPRELAGLPGSPEELVLGEPDQQQLAQHLNSCEACSLLAEAHWNLRRLGADARELKTGDPCPPTATWLQLVAVRPEEGPALYAHASSCSACAGLLREAMDLMETDELDGSAEELDGLASSTPTWQRRVAREMASAGHAGAPLAEGKVLLFFSRKKIALPLAAALLVGAVLGGALVWRPANPSESRLLALAYNKQRTLALRIAGAEPLPLVSFTRGAREEGGEPAELLALRLRARKHLDQTPNSPYWHQVMGEIDLLEEDGWGARRNFEIAQVSDEHLANLGPDLAAAWFEIGDQSGTAESYAKAVELYSQALESHPADASLLYYNRALCWERQNLIENALEDLRAALAAERSSDWRKAIQAEMDRLSAHSETPRATDDYEKALDESTSLLPQWPSSEEARAKITHSASLGIKHGDHWLRDWIDSPHTAVTAEADQRLVAAVQSGLTGKPDESIAQARMAMPLYRTAGDRPGVLRAELAELSAFQRLGRAADCLATAATLEKDGKIRTYPAMQAQLLLDRAACEFRLGDYYSTSSDLARTRSLSAESGLPFAALTATASNAEALRHIGMTSAAWQLNVAGLASCASINCSACRKYSLLYNMVISAEELDQPNTALSLMQIAEPFAALSNNQMTHAYAVEILATLAGRANDFAKAERGFAQTFELEQAIHDPVGLYKALWQIDHAEVLARHGDLQQSLNLLHESQSAITASDYLPGRVSFYHQLANSELLRGHSDEALASAQRSVAEAERMLPNLHTGFEREQWARENSAIYQTLVNIYATRGDGASALKAWEGFRSVPYRSDFPAADSGPRNSFNQQVLA